MHFLYFLPIKAFLPKNYLFFNMRCRTKTFRRAQCNPRNLRMSTLSKIAMMNRQTFSYLFRQITGMPFSKYIQYLRVHHAKELLKNTDRPQNDIASACGFQSMSFFHRVFKKLTGMHPGDYQKNKIDEQGEN